MATSAGPRDPAGSRAQEPERLAHFGPLEEALPADAERDPGLRQGRLQGRDLGVHPHQDRDLCGRGLVLHEAADRRHQQGELGVPVGAAPDRRSRPGWLSGHKPFLAPLRGEEAVRKRKDLRAAPVVAVQGHLASRRVADREARQERRCRAGEGVDRLILVAHDAEIVAIAQPQLEEALLEWVRVLVLVDAEPAVARPDRLGRCGVGLEQLDRPGEHVVEIEPARSVLLALVVRPEAHEQLDRDRRRPVAGLVRVRGRPEAPALRPFDLVGQVLRRREPVAARQASGEAADERDLGVEHRGRRLAIVAERPEMAQLGQGRRMEGPGGDARQAERAQARRPSRRRPCR